MIKQYLIRSFVAASLMWTLAILPVAISAQTRVSMPNNRYAVQEDVKIGREAAAQVDQQFPILNDTEVTRYVERVGAKLVANIPQEFRVPEFDYRFRVIDASDINAFALPGGPMYVNRGMIEAARNEGEMAGVMAHEISHIALRHATAQQTRMSNPWNQILGIGAILGGAILGGQVGAAAGQIFVQGYFMRYSREYENQADIVGARIMADAGYDPRDLANMFQTIAQQGGSRAPEFLSSHPDPGNRFQNINREAEMLMVSPNPIKITPEFTRAQNRLRQMAPAPTLQQIQEQQKTGQQTGAGQMGTGRYTSSVPVPSSSMRTYQGGNWVRINVPSNWEQFPSQSDVTFSPQGAFGNEGITHGAMIGAFRGQSTNLSQNSQEFVQGLLRANTYLGQRTGFQSTRLAGRQALAIALAGRSPITGRTEFVTVYTTQLRNGQTFYFIAVAPETESSRYNSTFQSMMNSIRLSD
jgi:beta-barrel assembly-enhancing protease